jgi:hypothetical protein
MCLNFFYFSYYLVWSAQVMKFYKKTRRAAFHILEGWHSQMKKLVMLKTKSKTLINYITVIFDIIFVKF